MTEMPIFQTMRMLDDRDTPMRLETDGAFTSVLVPQRMDVTSARTEVLSA